MPLPSLEQTITEYGLRPDKRLGQHFLTDENLLRQIVRCAGLKPEHHVIEIGPGPGGLTRELLESGAASVTALELDTRCLQALGELERHDTRLHLIQGDALHYRLSELTAAPRAVVANLPYNVGTRILSRYLREIHEHGSRTVEAMTLMLQQEVAGRLIAAPGGRAYGRLSVLAQWLCHVDYCLDVPPEAFTPPPRVMSSVVRLVPRREPAFAAAFSALEGFLGAAFGQRRKMLRGALKGWTSDPEGVLQSCDIDPRRRAETLQLSEIGRLLAARPPE